MISTKKALVACAVAAVAAVATTTPAHAATYATGVFTYTTLTGQCQEAYAGTGFGSNACSVTLTIGTFSVVVNNTDGTCSGAAPATLNIVSPSSASAPPASGTIVISHGVGQFQGYGTDGLTASVATAQLTGSRCRPQNTLGGIETLHGQYQLSV